MPVPDDRKKTKKTTAEAKIPGAYDGETVTRRRFMTASAHTAGGIATAAFTLPALGMAFGPVFEKSEAHWESVGKAADFPDDTYIPRTLTISRGIGEVGKSTVYVRKYSDKDTEVKDEYNDYVAISTRCMHLGCPVRYVDAAKRFICPCHGGVYDFAGKRSGGPPVRPLDRFNVRLRNGQLEIGPRYSVDSQLKKYEHYRDPGQDLDGIGKYLYPPRLSTPKP